MWGSLVGSTRYQIDISPPPVRFSAPYRFDISQNSNRQIGDLQEGHIYTVKLLQGSGVNPAVVDELTVVTSKYIFDLG